MTPISREMDTRLPVSASQLENAAILMNALRAVELAQEVQDLLLKTDIHDNE